MKQYLDLVKYVLENGQRKVNRTGVATLSCFGVFYKVNLAEGYPLLTTKKVYFKSMLQELFWYLSGEEHIRNLRQHTKIWDAWADEEGHLETAYGRFWRRFPVPEQGLPGEKWATKWVSTDPVTGQKTFDQIVRYNMVLHARYLIVSNGLQHYCCRIDYDTASYSFLEDIPHYNDL